VAHEAGGGPGESGWLPGGAAEEEGQGAQGLELPTSSVAEGDNVVPETGGGGAEAGLQEHAEPAEVAQEAKAKKPKGLPGLLNKVGKGGRDRKNGRGGGCSINLGLAY